MTDPKALVERLAVLANPARIAVSGTYILACGEAKNAIEALTREVERIKSALDKAEIAMPGGTTDWTLLDRVEIACAAATDQSDRARAEAAEARLAALKSAEGCDVEAAAQAQYETRIRETFKCEPGASWNPKSGQRTMTWEELPNDGGGKDIERRIASAALAAGCAPVRAQMQRALDHYDMRSELYTSDTDAAAGMANILRLALDGSGA